MTDGGGRLEVLYAPQVIAARVSELAREVAGLAMPRPLLVPILSGSFVFAADLMRALQAAGLELEVDFLMLSGYRRNTRQPGSVEILRDIDLPVADRCVLVIDDILATGRTLAFATDLLAARGAKVRTCVLLEKAIERQVHIVPDLVGFRCEDVFLVGYGMDISHRYRELPFIARLH